MLKRTGTVPPLPLHLVRVLRVPLVRREEQEQEEEPRRTLVTVGVPGARTKREIEQIRRRRVVAGGRRVHRAGRWGHSLVFYRIHLAIDTHPFRDVAPFLLLFFVETPTTFGR